MNSSSDCHEIEGVPRLYVDAFKGSYLRKTSISNNTFILTHYHGDHYQSLPREFKYQGPALIHCTTITAALLREVHQVPHHFVVEHKYGETWDFNIRDDETDGITASSEKISRTVKITFYDANHCPGAAIVLIELPNGTTHLHCGDMRYSTEMKDYPRLKDAVDRRAMEIVYLDTTYGHAKHDFCPQHEAVDRIASVVQEQTVVDQSQDDASSTLILLSCYSIGKEKVLWECSKRAKQPIFVSERKYKMLQCCHSSNHFLDEVVTLDPTKTDIHVIPMGLAGELWPYFQPNYPACRDYVEKLTHKRYSKVVAFLPTGWANASNWNKKNAIVSQSMPYIESSSTTPDRVEVEIRLIGYSEHSAFTELIDFVTFLKPRKVIPTVYADSNDRLKITNHFRNLVDSTRAKQQFFASMTKRSASSSLQPTTTPLTKRIDTSTSPSTPPPAKKVKSSILEEHYTPPSNNSRQDSLQSIVSELDMEKVQQLVGMGFSDTAAKEALLYCQGHLDAAVERLLLGVGDQTTNSSSSSAATTTGALDTRSAGAADQPIEICDSPNRSTPTTITSFFQPRKR